MTQKNNKKDGCTLAFSIYFQCRTIHILRHTICGKAKND